MSNRQLQQAEDVQGKLAILQQEIERLSQPEHDLRREQVRQALLVVAQRKYRWYHSRQAYLGGQLATSPA